jgi:hypothetical protein
VSWYRNDLAARDPKDAVGPRVTAITNAQLAASLDHCADVDDEREAGKVEKRLTAYAISRAFMAKKFVTPNGIFD